jgi:surface polysaccharide O-acyltransferase-like enzyme
MKTISNPNRIIFLDNIRSTIIICVLILHSGASYGTGVSFWPFHENNPIGIIDFFMFICDVFVMAIMFFIAGYFVLPDLLKKGLWRVIIHRHSRWL